MNHEGPNVDWGSDGGEDFSGLALRGGWTGEGGGITSLCLADEETLAK